MLLSINASINTLGLVILMFFSQQIICGMVGKIAEGCDEYSPQGYYDQDLKRVKIDRSIYCSWTTIRAIPRYTCCTPEPPTPASSNVSEKYRFPSYYLYKPQNLTSTDEPKRQWLNWRNEQPAKDIFSQYEKIVYLIHGWSESLQTSYWLNRTLRAWIVQRQTPVVLVDWSLKNKKYFQTVANAITVGKTIGFSVLKWDILEKADIVGHSCGGQVVGEAGNYVKEHGKLLKLCVVLDPAGPGFDTGNSKMRISKDDCQLVQGIHSSSPQVPLLGVLQNKVGSFHKVGSCDFYINCGNSQGRDCKEPKPEEKVKMKRSFHLGEDYSFHTINPLQLNSREEEQRDDSLCWHHRAPLVYASQVAKNCSFTINKCHDCSSRRITDQCSYDNESIGYLPPDNENCKSSDDSSYFVKTTSKYPYC